jgi:hypothetical protein
MLALTLAAMSFATAATEADPGTVIFKDDFNGKLAEGWSWEREDRANWRVGPAGLEVRVQPGNMWGGANNAKNVLFRSIPVPMAEPVEISVTLSNRPTAQWEQANLVWFYDDSNMVKLNMELVTGRFTIVMGREENDRARTVALVPLDDYAVELRLQAVGNRVRGQFRTRYWSDWRDVGECDLPVKGEPKASLHFYNGPANEEHWVRANNFTVRRLPPESVTWPRVRATENTFRMVGGQTQQTNTAAIGLENVFLLTNDPSSLAGAAKADSEQRVFRHQDGSCGWTWDRRASGSKQPIRVGVDYPWSQSGAFAAFDPEKPLAMESDVVTRLENDQGNHNLSVHLWLSATVPGALPITNQVSILFDWYGPEATGQTLNDGYRDYEYVAQADQGRPAVYQYRIKGLRGSPPKVNLQAFLADARKHGMAPGKVTGLWFGNEIWDGSRGGTLVTKLDLIINGQRLSSLAFK